MTLLKILDTVVAAVDNLTARVGDLAAEISELKVTRNGISVRSLKSDCVLVLGDSDFENRLKKYFLMKEALDQKNQNSGLIDLRFEDQIVLRSQI